MLTLEQMREGLMDRRIAKVSEETGISVVSLYKIKNGITKDPRHSTVVALTEYLTRVPGSAS